MSLLFAGILLFIALLSASFVWSFKKNEFMEQESVRCLNGLCEVNEEWSPKGRIHTNGFTIIKIDGKTKFIKQSKLCGASMLS
jgi:hypothetical protein